MAASSARTPAISAAIVGRLSGRGKRRPTIKPRAGKARYGTQLYDIEAPSIALVPKRRSTHPQGRQWQGVLQQLHRTR